MGKNYFNLGIQYLLAWTVWLFYWFFTVYYIAFISLTALKLIGLIMIALYFWYWGGIGDTTKKIERSGTFTDIDVDGIVQKNLTLDSKDTLNASISKHDTMVGNVKSLFKLS